MIKEVIEEVKYYTCKSDDVIETPGNYKEGDIMKVTDTKEEFVFKNNKWVKNFIATKSGLVNVFTEPVILVKSNMAREKITIQNNGIYPVMLKLTDIVSDENYDYVLKPSTVKNYGDGGVFTSDTIKMQISAMAINGETTLSIIEEVSV